MTYPLCVTHKLAKTFRLKGKGMPNLRGGYSGDQLIRVHVEVPTSLNSEQRKALEEFAVACGDAEVVADGTGHPLEHRSGVEPRVERLADRFEDPQTSLSGHVALPTPVPRPPTGGPFPLRSSRFRFLI